MGEHQANLTVMTLIEIYTMKTLTHDWIIPASMGLILATSVAVIVYLKDRPHDMFGQNAADALKSRLTSHLYHSVAITATTQRLQSSLPSDMSAAPAEWLGG